MKTNHNLDLNQVINAINNALPHPIKDLYPFPAIKDINSELNKATFILINPDDENFSLGTEDLSKESSNIWDYQIGTLNIDNKELPIFEY